MNKILNYDEDVRIIPSLSKQEIMNAIFGKENLHPPMFRSVIPALKKITGRIVGCNPDTQEVNVLWQRNLLTNRPMLLPFSILENVSKYE